jgi:hypothetical protein
VREGIIKMGIKTGGVYSRNRLFDTVYQAGVQDLPRLEDDVYVEDSTMTTAFDDFEDYLEDGWADFIKDFCE